MQTASVLAKFLVKEWSSSARPAIRTSGNAATVRQRARKSFLDLHGRLRAPQLADKGCSCNTRRPIAVGAYANCSTWDTRCGGSALHPVD